MQKQNVVDFFERRYEESQVTTAAYIADLLQELEQIAVNEKIAPLDILLKVARDVAVKISARG